MRDLPSSGTTATTTPTTLAEDTFVDIGIALFKRAESSTGGDSSHWALVAVQRPSTYSHPDVRVYQIFNRNPKGDRVPWFASFTQNLKICLSDDAGLSLLGVVHLTSIDMPIGQLHEFIKEIGAGQNGYNTKGLGWSNATWVIRIVEALAEAGMVEMPSTIGQFKLNIQEKGARLEVMKSWGDPLPVLNA